MSSDKDAIEVAKTKSATDIILWLVAITALVAATLTNQYLPAYWQPASSVWVRLGIIIALVIFALVCLAFTHQGSSFKELLSDARIELKRVTWPGKEETTQYTWQVVAVVIVTGLIIWALDNLFNMLVGLIIG